MRKRHLDPKVIIINPEAIDKVGEKALKLAYEIYMKNSIDYQK